MKEKIYIYGIFPNIENIILNDKEKEFIECTEKLNYKLLDIKDRILVVWDYSLGIKYAIDQNYKKYDIIWINKIPDDDLNNFEKKKILENSISLKKKNLIINNIFLKKIIIVFFIIIFNILIIHMYT